METSASHFQNNRFWLLQYICGLAVLTSLPKSPIPFFYGEATFWYLSHFQSTRFRTSIVNISSPRTTQETHSPYRVRILYPAAPLCLILGLCLSKTQLSWCCASYCTIEESLCYTSYRGCSSGRNSSVHLSGRNCLLCVVNSNGTVNPANAKCFQSYFLSSPVLRKEVVTIVCLIIRLSWISAT